MRDVRVPTFCNVCIEGLWLSLLRKIKLIDDIRENCQRIGSLNEARSWRRTLELSLLPLAQFRQDPVPHKESYAIQWTKDGKALDYFANRTRIEIDDTSMGTYTAEVKFATDEVRMDRDGVMVSTSTYAVTARCGQ